MAKKLSIRARNLKDRIEYQNENYKESYYKNLSMNERLFPYYDKALVITLYGEPVADSRPRFMKERDGTYNPHKAFLMRVFKEQFIRDELLQNNIIETPLGIKIRSFVTPEKKLQKAIGVAIVEEKHLSIKQKDNDNIEKVHWDVLQDPKYSVILDDRLVTHNLTYQFYSVDPRVEIEIQFPSKDILRAQEDYFAPYMEWIYKSAAYRTFRLYPKYIFNIEKIPERRFPEFFCNKMSELSVTYKQAKYILDYYNAKQIELLAEYCKVRGKTKVYNMNALAEVFQKETYPISSRKRLRRLQ